MLWADKDLLPFVSTITSAQTGEEGGRRGDRGREGGGRRKGIKYMMMPLLNKNTWEKMEGRDTERERTREVESEQEGMRERERVGRENE